MIGPLLGPGAGPGAGPARDALGHSPPCSARSRRACSTCMSVSTASRPVMGVPPCPLLMGACLEGGVGWGGEEWGGDGRSGDGYGWRGLGRAWPTAAGAYEGL